MKTPISYYGGKQSMLNDILPLIPPHITYVEPFAGGLAVLFAKNISKAEIINDLNANVTNFYEQLKMNFEELKNIINATPYCRDVYRKARVIYDAPFLFSAVHRAWAFWVVTNQGFSNQIGSWRASSSRGKESRMIKNKKESFLRELSERISCVQIENADAVHLIERFDDKDTFYYLDPPYVGANQGHYRGYSQEDFNELLEVLATLKGKFLLSSYPNEILSKFVKRKKWHSVGLDKFLSASNKRRKTEVLTYNYSIM